MKYTGRVYIVRERGQSVTTRLPLNTPLKEYDEYGHYYLEIPDGRVFSPNNPNMSWVMYCKIAEISFVNYLKELESL